MFQWENIFYLILSLNGVCKLNLDPGIKDKPWKISIRLYSIGEQQQGL